MPIDSETFQSGEPADSIEAAILELLYTNPEKAFNAHEVAIEVMGEGLSERNVERPSDVQTFMSEFLDVATVSTILDGLVDDARVHRRLVDVGRGKRSYYRAPGTVEAQEF